MKLRGTRLAERESLFTLDGGFKAFLPYQAKIPAKWSRFEHIPDPLGRFSTGSDELDAILGVGYPRGSTVLLEVDSGVSTDQYELIPDPTTLNFLSKGSAVVILPSSSVDHMMLRTIVIKFGLDEREVDRLLRVCMIRPSEKSKTPSLFSVDGVDATEDIKRIDLIQDELVREAGRSSALMIGCDSLIAYYGVEATTRIASIEASRAREKQSLFLLVLKPGYGEVTERLGAIANVHLKITKKYGSVLIYGIKPRTHLHMSEVDVSKGYPMPMLTPII